MTELDKLIEAIKIVSKMERPSTQLCPICQGKGNLQPAVGDIAHYRPCHGCDGKGWIKA